MVKELGLKLEKLVKKRILLVKKIAKVSLNKSPKNSEKLKKLQVILSAADSSIKGIKRALRIIQRPDKIILPKRNITKIEADIVEGLEKAKKAITEKIKKIKKNVVTLKAAQANLPEKKRGKIQMKLKVLERVLNKISEKSKAIDLTIKSISLETLTGQNSELSGKAKKLIKENTTKIQKWTLRVNLSSKKIAKLKAIISKLPEEKKPSVVQRIAYL